MPSDTTQYKLNDEIILSDKVPTTYGYNFKYWSTSKDGFAVKTPLKMGKHRITLYAIWQKKTFEINYNTNGGSPNPPKQVGEYKTKVTINAANPSKTGYSFKYWKDSNENKTYVKNDIVTLAKNLNLSAEYNANIYEITLDHQNGQNSINKIYEKYDNGFYSDPNADNDIASPNIANANKITTIPVPQKKGYNFQGYYTQPNGAGNKYIDESGKILISNTTVTNNIKLYAKYSANIYEITLDHQNGQNSINKIYEKYDNGFYSDSNTATKITTIAIPQKKGYKFLGYYTQPNGAGNKYIDENGKIIINNNAVNNNIKLYAQYSANIYEITLDHQNGQNSINKIYEKYNSGFYSSPDADNNIASPNIANTTKITTIAIPQKEGYNFQGYYTQPNGAGNKYIDESGKIIINNTTVTNNIKLYAYYTKKEYDITINVTNGTKNNPILTKIKYAESGEQKITPKDGYGLNASKGGAVSCSGNAEYSYNNNILKLTNVKGNITCTVNFVKTDYDVTLKIENGSISDLYNQVLNNGPIMPSIKNGSTKIRQSEPYIEYGLSKSEISVSELIEEMNLENLKEFAIDKQLGNCKGGFDGKPHVCQNTGKIDTNGLGSCTLYRDGSELKLKGSSSCSSGYILNVNGLVAYYVNLWSEDKKVHNVTRYKVIDIISSAESGLYKEENENSYYFRGKIENNYVYFAGRTWRILGLNEDKSIRLIGAFNTGNKINWYKRGADDENFVHDYVNNLNVGAYSRNTSEYTKEAPGIVTFNALTFQNQNGEPNSLVKTELENWYINNLTEYDSYIADSLFNNYTKYAAGIGNNQYYMACRYFYSNAERTHFCDSSRSSMSLPGNSDVTTNVGGIYQSKIGTITAEEVAKSGFLNSEPSKNYNNRNPLATHFLTQNYSWWTMSPSHAFQNTKNYCNQTSPCYNLKMAIVQSSTGLTEGSFEDEYYVRPVISLKAGTKATGNGTASNPYKIIPSDISQTFKVTDNQNYTFEYPIIPNYENEFKSLSCTNNQTDNATFNINSNTFSIKPTNNTVCTLTFDKPYYYTINLNYPTNKFDKPQITFGENYSLQKSTATNSLSLKLKFFEPESFKNLKIAINSYTYNDTIYTNLDNMQSDCPGFNKTNNKIGFDNQFNTSLNNGSCSFDIHHIENSGNDDDNVCTWICDGGTFEDTDSNQDDCWCE